MWSTHLLKIISVLHLLGQIKYSQIKQRVMWRPQGREDELREEGRKEVPKSSLQAAQQGFQSAFYSWTYWEKLVREASKLLQKLKPPKHNRSKMSECDTVFHSTTDHVLKNTSNNRPPSVFTSYHTHKNSPLVVSTVKTQINLWHKHRVQPL